MPDTLDTAQVDTAVADAATGATLPAPAPSPSAPQPEHVEQTRVATGGNAFDQFDAGPRQANVFDQFDSVEDKKPSLWEQARLASQESYYRGTLMGAFDMVRKGVPIEQIDNNPNLSPEQKESYKTFLRKQGDLSDVIQEKQAKVREDLTKWEALPEYSGPLEATARLGGMLYGGMWSPEAWVLRPVKFAGVAAGAVGSRVGSLAARLPGATAVSSLGARMFGAGSGAALGQVGVRAAETGAGMAAVQLVTDPAVQGLSIAAQTQAEYDPIRTVMAPFFGAALGAGMHVAGEAIGAGAARAARRMVPDDSAFGTGGTRAADGVPAAADRAPQEAAPAAPAAEPELPKPSPAAESARASMDAAAASPETIQQAPESANLPTTDGQPAGVFKFKAGDLAVDPERFQFKGGADDATGETGKLTGVKAWDQAKANQLIVWEDNAGKRFVADGHQRAGLAKRLDPNIEIPGLLLRERDGFSAADAMVMGAEKNIAEGTGSLVDAAKIMRANPEVGANVAGISDTRIRQATDLSTLGDEPWRQVINGVVTPEQGSIVGREIKGNPAHQQAAIDAIAKMEPRNAEETTLLVRRVRESEIGREADASQGSLFGDDPATSTVMDEVRIQANAMRALRSDRALMRTLGGNADRIEGAGAGSVSRDGTAAAKHTADQLLAYIDKLSQRQGPVRDALQRYAKEAHDGQRSHADAATAFVRDVRTALDADGGGRALLGAEGPDSAARAAAGADPAADAGGAGHSGERGGEASAGGAEAGASAATDSVEPDSHALFRDFSREATRPNRGPNDAEGIAAADEAAARLSDKLGIPAEGPRADAFARLQQMLRYDIPAAREAGDANAVRRGYYQASKLFEELRHGEPDPRLAASLEASRAEPLAEGERRTQGPGGLSLVVEAEAGGVRKGVHADGTPWEGHSPVAYGRIEGFVGADGMPLDFYMGPHGDKAKNVWVVNQMKPDGKTFDEHKVLFGFTDYAEAKPVFVNAFGSRRAALDRIGGFTKMTVDEFKDWLARNDLQRAIGRGAAAADSGPKTLRVSPEIADRIHALDPENTSLGGLLEDGRREITITDLTAVSRAVEAKRIADYEASAKAKEADAVKTAVVQELADPETAAIAKEVYGEAIPEQWTREAADSAAARGNGEAPAGGRGAGDGPGAEGGPAAEGAAVRGSGAESGGGAGPAEGGRPGGVDGDIQFRGGPRVIQQFDHGNVPARPDTGTPGQVPPAGNPPAPSPAGAADPVSSLYQQALDLSDAVGGTLRAGRVQRGALGQYDTAQGVMRARAISDFETVSHEVGHALETKIGAPLQQYIAANAAELGRLDYEVGRLNPREGWAEAMRALVTNPAYLAANEPALDASIRAFLKATRPEIYEALETAAKGYRAYLDAPSGLVVKSNVVDRNIHEGILASIKHDGLLPTMRAGLQQLYERTMDHLSPVNLTVRDITRTIRDQNGGRLVDLKHADDPNVMLRLAQRSHQAGVQDAMDGVRSYDDPFVKGPSLRGALIVAAGDPSLIGRWKPDTVADFSAYLVARRAEYMWRKFDAGLIPNRPVAFNKGDAAQALADFEAKHPTFKAGGDMVHDYGRALLQKQFDGGLIDRELFDKLMQEEFYVPLYRNMRDKPLASMSSGAGRTGGSQGPGLTDTVKRFKGSDREIIDPIQGMLTQTFLVNRTLAHNDAVKALAGLARQAGPGVGHLVEEIPAKSLMGSKFNVQDAMRNAARANGLDPMDTQALMGAVVNAFGDDPVFGTMFQSVPTRPGGEPILFYKEGGSLKALRLASEEEGRGLYEAFIQQPAFINDMWVRMIGTTAKTLRSGVTANPVFAVTNFIRDQIAVGVLRPDYIPFYHGLKGTAKELGQTESAKLYAYYAGVTPGAAVGSVEKIVEGGVQDLAKKGYLVNRLSSFHGLMELAGVTESGTRIGVFDQVYKREIARGRTPDEAGIAAAYEASDMLDFSRHGSRTMIMTRLIPFINAAWQGTDKARRVMVEPLLRKARGDVTTVREQEAVTNAMLAWGKFLGVGGGIGFAWAALNSQQDAYVNADPRLKATHLIVPMGNDRVFVVPKPFELGLGINAGEEAYAAMVQGDQRWDDRILEAISETLVEPFNPKRWIEGVPGLKTYFELQTGKSLYTKRDIVPADLAGMAPAEQWDARTSEIAKAMGRVTGTSPKKWDYAAGSLFGNYGRDLAAASTMSNPNAPEQPVDQMIFARRLIKSTTNGSDITQKFWAQISQTSGTYAAAKTTFDSLSAQKEDGRAQAFLARQTAPVRAFVTLNSAADPDTGKPMFDSEDRLLHPLARAAAAGQVILGLTKELRANTQTGWEEGEPVPMSPQLRGQAIQALQTLSMIEQRNALIINREPGYERQKLVDPETQFAVLKAISPTIATELATRYASKKIPTTAAIAQAWPEAQRRLVQEGGDADIKELTADVKAEGPAFDGDAVKKPLRRKGVIRGINAGAGGTAPVLVDNPLQ